MINFKNILIIFIVTIISAFIFVYTSSIFNKIFIQSNIDYMNAAINAFMGAFFAFLFVRITQISVEKYEEEVKHYNALVRLEYLCHEYLNIIFDNIQTIDNFIETSEDAFGKNIAIFYSDRLQKLSVDKDIALRLSNIDLINEVFKFNIGLIKMNSSITTVNSTYKDIVSAFIQKDISYDSYKKNVLNMLRKMFILKHFLISLEKDTKELLATTRLLTKNMPLLARLYSHLFKKKLYTGKFNKKIGEEIKKLESEIVIIKEKSQKEIDETLRKLGRNI